MGTSASAPAQERDELRSVRSSLNSNEWLDKDSMLGFSCTARPTLRPLASLPVRQLGHLDWQRDPSPKEGGMANSHVGRNQILFPSGG